MSKNDQVLLETRLGPGEVTDLSKTKALDLRDAFQYRITVDADTGSRPSTVSCGELVLEVRGSDDGEVFDEAHCLQIPVMLKQRRKNFVARTGATRAAVRSYVKPVVKNHAGNPAVDIRVTGSCR